MNVTPVLRDYLLEQAITQHNIEPVVFYYDSTWEDVSVLQLNKEVTGWFFVIAIDQIGIFEVKYNYNDFKDKLSFWSL